jgi:hypothetical protein
MRHTRGGASLAAINPRSRRSPPTTIPKDYSMPQIIVTEPTPTAHPKVVALPPRAAAELAGSENEDQLAAEWLYAWAYNALQPGRDSLAARITSGAPRQASRQRATRDPASDRPARTLTSNPRQRAAGRRRELDRGAGRLRAIAGGRTVTVNDALRSH